MPGARALGTFFLDNPLIDDLKSMVYSLSPAGGAQQGSWMFYPKTANKKDLQDLAFSRCSRVGWQGNNRDLS
jgi:hypothetical protein